MFQWSSKPTDQKEMGWGINRYLLVNNEHPLPNIFQETIGQKVRTVGSGLGSAINAGLNLFQGICNFVKFNNSHQCHKT